jgi:hypothetical protein
MSELAAPTPPPPETATQMPPPPALPMIPLSGSQNMPNWAKEHGYPK